MKEQSSFNCLMFIAIFIMLCAMPRFQGPLPVSDNQEMQPVPVMEVLPDVEEVNVLDTGMEQDPVEK